MVSPLATKLPWELANPRWAGSLNPIIALPILNGNQLTSIVLTAGVPRAINHLLGRMQQGWIMTDNAANAAVWRTQPFSTTTLTLQASADTTINVWVF